MISPVNAAIVALAVLLVIAVAGIIIGSWLRPILAKSDIVDLSTAGHGRRERPTVDRDARAGKVTSVKRRGA